MADQNVYQGIVAEAYDIWFAGETFDDTAFYGKLIREVPGRALEIGSGTGRLLIPYLQAGLDVEGVDCSAEMLDICRAKAAAKGLEPRLYEQRAEALDLPGVYATIFIPLASFMCIADRADAERALTAMYNHLDEGGQLVVPLFIPPTSSNHEWKVTRRGMRHDGAEIITSTISSVQFHEQVQTSTSRYEIIRDGVLEETRFSTSALRWYYKHEFTMMLERAGYQSIAVLGGYEGQPLNEDQTFMIFRARKGQG